MMNNGQIVVVTMKPVSYIFTCQLVSTNLYLALHSIFMFSEIINYCQNANCFFFLPALIFIVSLPAKSAKRLYVGRASVV